MASTSNEFVQQFKILAKSTSGKATAAIVEQVIKHKQIYMFGEILDLPCVQNLKGTENDATFRLLEIFCFGTYQDFIGANLPPPTDVQLFKLRQLTIVSLGLKNRTLSYEVLFTELGIEGIRSLEDLIIPGIYNGLFVGKLNQDKRQFEIFKIVSRDVNPNALDKYIEQIGTWCSNSEALLQSLDNAIENLEGAKASFALSAQEALKIATKNSTGKTAHRSVSATEKMKNADGQMELSF